MPGFLPHKQKMVVVIGAPIDVPRVEEPSADQVEALHAKYVADLKRLYSQHKHRMGAEWAERRPNLYLEDEALPGEGESGRATKKRQ